jgi:hypothetical protein
VQVPTGTDSGIYSFGRYVYMDDACQNDLVVGPGNAMVVGTQPYLAWRLEWLTAGKVRIASLTHPGKYLGAPKACAARAPGVFRLSDATATTTWTVIPIARDV